MIKTLSYCLAFLLASAPVFATGKPMAKHTHSSNSDSKTNKYEKSKPAPANLGDELHELQQAMTQMNKNMNDMEISQDINFSINAVSGATFQVSF